MKNIKIDESLEKYISDNSYDLHPVQKEIIEYNNIYETGFLQTHGATISLTDEQQINVKVRYNWVHDTEKYGIFFDGNDDSYGAYVHHNIVWNCSAGIIIRGGKSDFLGGHYVYNNTVFNNIYNDIVILNTENGINANYYTLVINNLCNTLSGHISVEEELSPELLNLIILQTLTLLLIQIPYVII